jgi:plastocyanin domain-containing protein
MSDVVYINSVTEVTTLNVVQEVTTIDTADGRVGPSGLSVVMLGVAGNITVQTGKSRYYAPRALTISQLRASVDTPPTGAPLIVSLRNNGSIIATATIAAGTNTGTTTLALAVAAGDYLQADVTQVGSTIAGADLTVQVEF